MSRRPGPAAIPALRCHIGDAEEGWVYYVTAMKLAEVAERVRPSQEFYDSRELADWIQRTLDQKHAQGIAEYLQDEDQRFFGALVVGVYGGQPRWTGMRLSDPLDELDELQERRVEETVGVLRLNGQEKLFAIDGQHRVAGIKEALRKRKKSSEANPQAEAGAGADGDLRDEEVAVIFVAHRTNGIGRQRTRRLFVTLNSSAKKVSTRDVVALSEDDGFAITARRLVDEYEPLEAGTTVSLSGSANIGISHERAVTSVIGLYRLAKRLYLPPASAAPQPSILSRSRPDGDVLEAMYVHNCGFWEAMKSHCKEMREVLSGGGVGAKAMRVERHHLLFRPIGQEALAGAVQLMVSRGANLVDAAATLVGGTSMEIDAEVWHDILWDPVGEKMLNKNRTAAETLLLRGAGQDARNESAAARLDRLETGREAARR